MIDKKFIASLEFDETDKKIIQVMLDHHSHSVGRWMTINQIKIFSKLNWKTVNKHLQELKRKYEIVYDKPMKVLKTQGLERIFMEIHRKHKKHTRVWRLNVKVKKNKYTPKEYLHKYPSCTAPIGQFCNKHQSIHR